MNFAKKFFKYYLVVFVLVLGGLFIQSQATNTVDKCIIGFDNINDTYTKKLEKELLKRFKEAAISRDFFISEESIKKDSKYKCLLYFTSQPTQRIFLSSPEKFKKLATKVEIVFVIVARNSKDIRETIETNFPVKGFKVNVFYFAFMDKNFGVNEKHNEFVLRKLIQQLKGLLSKKVTKKFDLPKVKEKKSFQKTIEISDLQKKIKEQQKIIMNQLKVIERLQKKSEEAEMFDITSKMKKPIFNLKKLEKEEVVLNKSLKQLQMQNKYEDLVKAMVRLKQIELEKKLANPKKLEKEVKNELRSFGFFE